jgi:hypothetical protein
MMAEMPFPVPGRGVALLFEKRADEFFARMNAGLAGVVECADHAHAVRITTAQQRRARCRAYWLRNVEVRQAHAFRGDPVDVWRADAFCAIASHVAVAEVVGQDEYDVGPVPRRRCGGGGRQRAPQQKQEQKRASVHFKKAKEWRCWARCSASRKGRVAALITRGGAALS